MKLQLNTRRMSMNMHMRSMVPALLLCLFAGLALAGNQQRTGSSGAQELLIPVGARGIGLGRANLGFADRAETMYWNPAGVSRATGNVDTLFSNMSSLR